MSDKPQKGVAFTAFGRFALEKGFDKAPVLDDGTKLLTLPNGQMVEAMTTEAMLKKYADKFKDVLEP